MPTIPTKQTPLKQYGIVPSMKKHRPCRNLFFMIMDVVLELSSPSDIIFHRDNG